MASRYVVRVGLALDQGGENFPARTYIVNSNDEASAIADAKKNADNFDQDFVDLLQWTVVGTISTDVAKAVKLQNGGRWS